MVKNMVSSVFRGNLVLNRKGEGILGENKTKIDVTKTEV